MTLAAKIEPLHLTPFQPFVVTVSGAHQFAESAVFVDIEGCTALEMDQIAGLSIDVDADGNGAASHPGLPVGRETAIWVTAIQRGVERHNLDLVSPALIAPDGGNLLEVPADALSRLLEEMESTYTKPIGNPASIGAKKHRVVYGVEGVLLTRALRLPGVVVQPIADRPLGVEDLHLMNQAIAASGSTRVIDNTDPWSVPYRSAHPWISIFFSEVWAADHAAAEAATEDTLARLLSLLALKRGSRGTAIAVSIEEEISPGESGNFKIRVFQPGYRGNLIGGQMSGESQSTFHSEALTLENDPILRLCLDLYAEALAEPNIDVKLFRLWSAVETLAINRVEEGLRVTLLDGSFWPDGGTTKQAGPRVYTLLKASLVDTDEPSMVSPAEDLYHAVRAWIARRDATAHYGGFDPASSVQNAKSWFDFAQLTTSNDDTDSWVRLFERLCRNVFQRELS